MALIDVKDLKGKHIITDDALDIGVIFDFRYRLSDWKVMGIRFTGNQRTKELDSKLKSTVFLEIGKYKYTIKDVVLPHKTMADLRGRLSVDGNVYESLALILDKNVITVDGVTIGTVESALLDPDDWQITSLVVKLKKEAHQLLGIKKGLIHSKKISGVLTSYIGACNETGVHLKVNCEELKSSVVIMED